MRLFHEHVDTKSQNVPNYMIEAKKWRCNNLIKQLNFIKELALYPEKRVILQDIGVEAGATKQRHRQL
jgi:hypothetical protein